MKIFGREPVYVLAFVAIALKLGSAYGLGWDAEQQAVVMAVLSLAVAVGTAVVLKTGALAASLVNLAQGILALFLAFGMELTAEDMAMWGGLIEAAVAMFLHREVTAPVPSTPLEDSSPMQKSATG